MDNAVNTARLVRVTATVPEICMHNVKLGPGCFCPQCPTASIDDLRGGSEPNPPRCAFCKAPYTLGKSEYGWDAWVAGCECRNFAGGPSFVADGNSPSPRQNDSVLPSVPAGLKTRTLPSGETVLVLDLPETRQAEPRTQPAGDLREVMRVNAAGDLVPVEELVFKDCTFHEPGCSGHPCTCSAANRGAES